MVVAQPDIYEENQPKVLSSGEDSFRKEFKTEKNYTLVKNWSISINWLYMDEHLESDSVD